MPYIEWLMEKLLEEIMSFGPDVVVILMHFRALARTETMRSRVELAIQLWEAFPATTSRDFIVLMLLRMTNDEFDQKLATEFRILKFRVLMDWFLDYCKSQNL